MQSVGLKRASEQMHKECPVHGKFFAHHETCPFCEEEARKKAHRIGEYKRNSRVPERFRGLPIDSFQGESEGVRNARGIARKYVDAFEQRKEAGTCLIFVGKPGTGKTHLACSMAWELMNKERPVIYATEYQITGAIKNTWKERDKSEGDIIDKLCNPDLLIIDECGISLATDTDRVLLYQVINARYECKLPMLLIANLTVDELTGHIGERAMDRLKEGGGVTVPFTWESFRG